MPLIERESHHEPFFFPRSVDREKFHLFYDLEPASFKAGSCAFIERGGIELDDAYASAFEEMIDESLKSFASQASASQGSWAKYDSDSSLFALLFGKKIVANEAYRFLVLRGFEWVVGGWNCLNGEDSTGVLLKLLDVLGSNGTEDIPRSFDSERKFTGFSVPKPAFNKRHVLVLERLEGDSALGGTQRIAAILRGCKKLGPFAEQTVHKWGYKEADRLPCLGVQKSVIRHRGSQHEGMPPSSQKKV